MASLSFTGLFIGTLGVIGCGFVPLAISMTTVERAGAQPMRGQPYAVAVSSACHVEADASSPVVRTFEAGTLVREDARLTGWSSVGGCFIAHSGIVRL